MKQIPKKTTDDALVQEFLKKGGKISVGKTKPLPSELGLSNNTWNNKLTREEKSARNGKWADLELADCGHDLYPRTFLFATYPIL